MKKILINAANLHNGGGVQVATSFIAELAKFRFAIDDCEVFIYASSEVNDNLGAIGIKTNVFKNYEVLNVYGIGALNYKIARAFSGFDLTFTIFGPVYLPWKIKNHIVGFAQLWILYPSSNAYDLLPPMRRIIFRIKYFVQWLIFRWSAVRLVVEMQHVKDRLISFKKYSADRVDVVSNCVSPIFFDNTRWSNLNFPEMLSPRAIKIGYLSRAYSHKNLQILLAVAKAISKFEAIEVQFFVTLNSDEWSSFSDDYRSTIVNIGPLTLAQCPTFYESMDGVIFPSLLECFSATPLEALVMRRPLFASDRRFVRDCCKDNAIYFDPLDAEDIAKKIFYWFKIVSYENRFNHIEKAYWHVKSLPNSSDRTLGYIQIINRQLINR